MAIKIHFVTSATQINTASPTPPDGWVFVRPSSPYTYFDGIEQLDVTDRVTQYGVSAGHIYHPFGVPAHTIVVNPNINANQNPDDTFWEFFFDLSQGYKYSLFFKFDTKLRSDRHGVIEIGDINPAAVILGSLVVTVANAAARLALPDSVGQHVYQSDVDAVFEQVASPASTPSNWVDVTVRWRDVLVSSNQAIAESGLAAHIAALDPHPQYLLRSDTSQEAQAGAVSDGQGFVVRANPVTGKIDPNWIDTALIDVDANEVEFTPAGNIVSTNVQTAIEELDSEKVAKAGDTMAGNLTVPRILIGNAPTAINHGTRKDYVDAGDSAANANANNRVLKAGDTVSGTLTFTHNNPLISRNAGNVVIRFEDAATNLISSLINSVSGANNYIGIQSHLGAPTLAPATLGIRHDGINAPYPFFDNDASAVEADLEPLLRSSHGSILAPSSVTTLASGLTSIKDLGSAINKIGEYIIFGATRIVRTAGTADVSVRLRRASDLSLDPVGLADVSPDITGSADNYRVLIGASTVVMLFYAIRFRVTGASVNAALALDLGAGGATAAPGLLSVIRIK